MLTAIAEWDTLRRAGRNSRFTQGKEADMRRVLFLTLLVMTAPIAFAQDPVKVDAQHYKILLENDQVRVLKIKYNPKEKSVMHEHPASVVVFLADAQTKFTLPDGSSTTAGPKAGEVQFSEAAKHLPENIGNTPVDAVLVELKGKPAMPSTTIALDPVKVDPTRHKVEVENDRVRVLRISFKPHDKTMEHEHPKAVAIYLTDAKTKFKLADGKTREGSGKRGDAIWAAAERHQVENMTDKPAEIILVELK
jgi:quercetin dioxygenase-like cupin family protein